MGVGSCLGSDLPLLRLLGWNVAHGSCKGIDSCGGARGMRLLGEHCALCPVRRPVRTSTGQERRCGLALRGGLGRGGDWVESGCLSKVDSVGFVAIRDNSSISSLPTILFLTLNLISLSLDHVFSHFSTGPIK